VLTTLWVDDLPQDTSWRRRRGFRARSRGVQHNESSRCNTKMNN
jgi:hypothetical protein